MHINPTQTSFHHCIHVHQSTFYWIRSTDNSRISKLVYYNTLSWWWRLEKVPTDFFATGKMRLQFCISFTSPRESREHLLPSTLDSHICFHPRECCNTCFHPRRDSRRICMVPVIPSPCSSPVSRCLPTQTANTKFFAGQMPLLTANR